MITLPTALQVGDPNKVTKLLLVGHQGSGKTSLQAGLPKSLLIDLESGSEQIGNINVLNLKREAGSQNVGVGKLLMETIAAIKAENSRLTIENKVPTFAYDYISLDGITALGKLARIKATSDFKKSVVGKGMLGKGAIINDVITDVPESGWLWYFQTFNNLYEELQGLAGKALILIAHSKQGSLMKDGIKLDAADMNLERKLALDLLRDVDACGMVYKSSPNTVSISFKENDKDLTIKSRAVHLRNQEFVISELDLKTNKFTYHWDQIFLDLKK